MKRWIHASEEILIPKNIAHLFERLTIEGLVFTDDIENYRPRDNFVYAATKKTLDYTTMTTEQLLQLPKKLLSNIHDVRILRKLPKSELTPDQQREVTQANQQNFHSSIKEVKHVLEELRNQRHIFVWFTDKNKSFYSEVENLGGEIHDTDILNIVRDLHVKDYCYSTYSYLDTTWCDLLMVFEYKGSYTFPPLDGIGDSVTLNSVDIYLKFDVNEDSAESYSALSFHNPEFTLSHPYKDYPISKE